MKLPKNYFENLSASKFRAYLKLLPNMKKDSTKAITMLIFTFVGSSILGVFAINPTLSTITQLHKQLDDSQFVYKQLTTKINNLSSLKQQHTILSNDLPFVFDAIPKDSSVATLIGQIETLAIKKGITINSLRIDKVQLNKIEELDKNAPSFIFTLDARGSYNQMTDFAGVLTRFDRILTIDIISLAKDPGLDMLILSIKGRGYFKQ